MRNDFLNQQIYVRGRRALVASVFGVACGWAGVALATPPIDFNVHTREIEPALIEYAKQANIQVVVIGAGLEGLVAHPLHGKYDQKQALRKLIGAAPVSVTWLGDSTVAVRANAPRKQTIALKAPLAAAESAAPAAREAPGELEAVVVTARKREENLQTTPIAVTAVTSEGLERRNVISLEQIARLAPNVSMYQIPGGLGTVSAFIRGIGYQDYTPAQDSAIAIYTDGVVSGRQSIALMDLVEPERIEVLRGPQGTLFGRNTTAGAILITTHTPQDEFGGTVKASYGTFSKTSIRARIDTGLLGESGVKMSAAFQHRQQNGTYDAPARPRDLDPGAENSDAYWLKGVGDWGRLSAALSTDYSNITGTPGPDQVVRANPNVQTFLALSSSAYGGTPYTISATPLNTVSEAFAGLEHIWSEGVNLTLNYELNEKLSIKSISSVRAYKRSDPWSLGPANIMANVGTVAQPRIVAFDGLFSLFPRSQSQRQRSEELQLLGKWGDFDYVAGAYYFTEGAYDYSRQRLPVIAANGLTAVDAVSDRLFSVRSKSIAAFSQVDWRPSILDNKLEVTGGLRWTKDNRGFAQLTPFVRSAGLETKNTSVLGSVKYQWTSDIMTYAKYSTAYRAGGFNVRSALGINPVYQPEKLRSYETGFKIDAPSNRLRVNGAVFYNRYNNLQTSEFFTPTTTDIGGSSTVNANARFQGFELEVQAIPIEHMTVTAAVGHVDRKYLSYPKAAPGGVITPGCKRITSTSGAVIGQDCAEVSVFNFSPVTSADLSINYTIPEEYGIWSFFVNYSYKSHTEYNISNIPSAPNAPYAKQKPYGLLGARVALSDIQLTPGNRAQISVFGDNLTNERYHVQATDFGSFLVLPFATRRTVGVEAKVDF